MGVAVGIGVVGSDVSVGRGVSVGSGASALAVAKAACPVNATTVEMWLGGKGVGADSADCEQADKSVTMNAVIRILYFMMGWESTSRRIHSIELTISKILRDVLFTVRKWRCIY